jgi:hypothetical protein
MRYVQRPDKRGRIFWALSADPNWGGIERIVCRAPACGFTYTRTVGSQPSSEDLERWRSMSRGAA